MPNHEFENYFALVSRLMRLTGSQKESIRHELRDHLETRISELVESGVDRSDATRRALEEFGDAAVLAGKFQAVFQVNQRRWMMRFATFSIAVTFLAAVLVMSMWPSPARFGAPSSSVAQDDSFAETSVSAVPNESMPAEKLAEHKMLTSDDIDARLKQPVDFKYDDTAFIQVMDEIRDQFGMNILLDQSALDDSLSEDELIEFTIKNTRLSTALRMMLVTKNATYMIDDGVLRIISLDVASDPEFHRRKIFDCRQLLERITRSDPRVGSPMSVEMLKPGIGGGFGGSGLGGGVFNRVCQLGGGGKGPGPGVGGTRGPGPRNVSAEAEMLKTGHSSEFVNQENDESSDPVASAERSEDKPEAVDAGGKTHRFIVRRITAEGILISLVKNSVDPDGWDESNGDGTLMIVGGFMIVTQSQETLEEIEELITDLERRMK